MEVMLASRWIKQYYIYTCSDVQQGNRVEIRKTVSKNSKDAKKEVEWYGEHRKIDWWILYPILLYLKYLHAGTRCALSLYQQLYYAFLSYQVK